ncbi:hypothetical protein [Candidatus Finniella inopinata]|uniref:Mechanosensitive ion channel MscS porin domain-containing protein n=1 Tax=Candidatus Finniella inopinata TaxID=1696036 RepID=A0A4Q7DIA5_9PROT|nr:hypothetical protein [Candidatus Finniella inopinata]RZI45694.1 hypothetical protein EQU50_06220 [Candidatus Finniella inopinata]
MRKKFIYTLLFTTVLPSGVLLPITAFGSNSSDTPDIASPTQPISQLKSQIRELQTLNTPAITLQAKAQIQAANHPGVTPHTEQELVADLAANLTIDKFKKLKGLNSELFKLEGAASSSALKKDMLQKHEQELQSIREILRLAEEEKERAKNDLKSISTRMTEFEELAKEEKKARETAEEATRKAEEAVEAGKLARAAAEEATRNETRARELAEEATQNEARARTEAEAAGEKEKEAKENALLEARTEKEAKENALSKADQESKKRDADRLRTAALREKVLKEYKESEKERTAIEQEAQRLKSQLGTKTEQVGLLERELEEVKGKLKKLSESEGSSASSLGADTTGSKKVTAQRVKF